MFGRIHQWLPAMAGVLGVTTVWADAGYLPTTGPVPLRFRVPPPHVIQQIKELFPPAFLPPFFPSPTLISLPPPPATPPDPSKGYKVPDAPVAATNKAAVEFSTVQPVAELEPQPGPDGIVSPQMLLRYFRNSTKTAANSSTNASGSDALPPLGFNPPVTIAQPTPLPESKATYSTSP